MGVSLVQGGEVGAVAALVTGAFLCGRGKGTLADRAAAARLLPPDAYRAGRQPQRSQNGVSRLPTPPNLQVASIAGEYDGRRPPPRDPLVAFPGARLP